MTRDQHTTGQAPGKPLNGPQGAETPAAGTPGGPDPQNGAQAGAESFGIQPGQIYRHCDPRESIRIRIVSYRHGDARAHVVDAVTGKRYRQILVTYLHASATTRDGRPRRSGYALEQGGEP
ncbi:hypothetical protein [Streptomyces longwoodensis]|uniref:hypothetical protein n=1 Tax=Streptomyces longwoodensis TaxID=68231 RepID=UPI00382B00B6